MVTVNSEVIQITPKDYFVYRTHSYFSSAIPLNPVLSQVLQKA